MCRQRLLEFWCRSRRSGKVNEPDQALSKSKRFGRCVIQCTEEFRDLLAWWGYFGKWRGVGGMTRLTELHRNQRVCPPGLIAAHPKHGNAMQRSPECDISDYRRRLPWMRVQTV